jgi:hypothetical protein
VVTVLRQLPHLKKKPLRLCIPALVWLISVAFCGLSDTAGARFLQDKKDALTHNYRVEWKKDSSAANDAKVVGNPALQHQMEAGVFEINVSKMQESVRLGVYQPPEDRP